MSHPLAVLDEDESAKVQQTDQPTWIEPMLATLVDEHFSDPDWIYERKLDGVRILIFRRNGDVRLVTRNEKSRNATYPELVDALKGSGLDLVADSEIVAFDGNRTSFSRLQEDKDAEKVVRERPADA